MILFFFINVASFFFILKISYLYFNQKMYYPFRIAEINAFLINNIFVIIIMFYLFEIKELLLILLLNLLIFWIIFHISNMIQTSPRTKILLDLYNYNKIQKSESMVIVLLNRWMNSLTYHNYTNNRTLAMNLIFGVILFLNNHE